jgi:hypothetical protein
MVRFTGSLGALAVIALAACGCNGSDSAAQSGCSNTSLEGAYIYAQDGFNVAGDTASQRTPFAQAGREVFNGDGTMTGAATGNFNGTVVRTRYSGAYTVEPGCSGQVTFTDEGGAVSHYDIFLEDGGAEFGFVQTDPGIVTAAFQRRRTSSIDDCSLATLRGTYVYAGDGFVVEAGSSQRVPFATAGREVYPGDGTVTAVDTTVTNGVAQRSELGSTYTLASDCAGVYTYDDDPDNPYDIFADPSGAEFAYVATAPDRVAAGYERRR